MNYSECHLLCLNSITKEIVVAGCVKSSIPNPALYILKAAKPVTNEICLKRNKSWWSIVSGGKTTDRLFLYFGKNRPVVDQLV